MLNNASANLSACVVGCLAFLLSFVFAWMPWLSDLLWLLWDLWLLQELRLLL